jgi:CheY-like chemotaxis protein/HPt (histidine-containing phosphotransfer) domain-containing protein
LPFYSAANAAGAPRYARAPDTHALRGRHLLVVDDNEFNLEVARELLSEFGIDAEVASDAAQGLEKMRGQHFDWVLMDIQMPGMDGMSATRVIRQNDSLANTCVIALTANALDDDRARYLDAGMNDVMTKPIDPQILCATLLKWLGPAGTAKGAAHPESGNAAAPASNQTQGVLAGRDQARWDMDVFAKMLGEDVAMQRRLLASFLPNAHNQCHAISGAVGSGHWQEAAEVAHKLKSAARTVGAMRLGALCEALERAGRQDDGANCRLLCQRLNEETGKIGSVMGNWLDVSAPPAARQETMR